LPVPELPLAGAGEVLGDVLGVTPDVAAVVWAVVVVSWGVLFFSKAAALTVGSAVSEDDPVLGVGMYASTTFVGAVPDGLAM
jgi:hypothetical protein